MVRETQDAPSTEKDFFVNANDLTTFTAETIFFCVMRWTVCR